MQTGRDIHRGIVRRIRRVRRELDERERSIDGLQLALGETGERRCAAIRALAEFHLPAMREDAVAATLAGMESSVRAIFDEKKDRLREVERRIPEQRDEVAAAEAALASVTEGLNETGEERARLARVVFGELQAMPRWQRLFEQARLLEARVTASEQRHEATEREQAEKVPAYESDALFSYLARRGYGTARATGNVLTRRLDGWVAEVTRYEDVRASYDFLNALPGHAAAVLEEDRAALATALLPLARLEEDVMDSNGLTPVLARGEQLYAEREAARQQVREAEAALRELTGELAALHDERGSYYESAIDGLEAFLEGRTLDELVAMARATRDPRDDALVAQLLEIDSRLAELRAELAGRRKKRTRLAKRLAGLEEIRD
ncbi:MAG: hypothetical protein F4018_14250, partial [Acidobacteria bacterium]|nr:hypothetical protein [Acidobacteriota bacterium]